MSPDGLAGARVHHAASAGRWLANPIREIPPATVGSGGVTLCVTMCGCIPPFEGQAALASSLFAAPVGPGPVEAETVRHNA